MTIPALHSGPQLIVISVILSASLSAQEASTTVLQGDRGIPGQQGSLQQPQPVIFTQADRQKLIDAAQHLKPEDVPPLEQKAEAGDVEAQIVMGMVYMDGNAVPRDYQKALILFQKAAAKGHPMAENSLGIMYLNGQGIERNPAEAFKWFQKAVEQGYAQAEYDLGYMYVSGRGIERNPAEAFKWFQKAAEQGYAQADRSLGLMYYKGEGVKRDQAKAVELLRKAAELGSPEGMYDLGAAYAEGQAVPRDYAQAANWYRKAAEQDYTPAQFDLAMAYHEGRGVSRDMQEAAKWFEKASNLGRASATYYLARMYLEGSAGYSAAQSASLEKFQKAAEQGYPRAAMNLGEIHANWLMTRFLTGSGRDYRQACRWLYIAQELQQRHQWDLVQPGDTKLVERDLPGKIKKIDKQLSSGDLATCQREAADWAKAHPTEPPIS
jgi:TPR repeat protein